MSDLSITPANVKLVDRGSGLPTYGMNAATTISAGQIIRIAAGRGSFWSTLVVPASNNDAVGGGDVRGLDDASIFFATANASSGQLTQAIGFQSGFLKTPGVVAPIINLGASTTNNTMYFLSRNGGICLYADLSVGDNVVIVGVGLGSNKILFAPRVTGLIR